MKKLVSLLLAATLAVGCLVGCGGNGGNGGEKNPGEPQYIFTEVGVGYRMVEGD